jgi:uncharacterized lipoprotein
MSRSVVAICTICVVVLVLAACGSSGGGLSKADYAKQADAICTRYAKALKALAQPRGLTDLPRYTDKSIPLAQRVLDDVRKLKPPKSEQVLADRWIAENQKTLNSIKQLAKAAAKNDRPAAKVALAAGTKSNVASNELAGRLGMVACTKG